MRCKYFVFVERERERERDPADIWRRRNNVGSTSVRRHDVASTLVQHSFKVVCPLGERERERETESQRETERETRQERKRFQK